MLLPILAVELPYRDLDNRCRIQTSYVDAVTVWVRPRNIERFDPTYIAEEMLGDTSVEGVGR